MQNRIDEAKAGLKEIENKQRELADRKGLLHQELAELMCPFKVGDIGVISNWSHKGKKCQIISIFWNYSDWNIRVQIYKKDGTLGQLEVVLGGYCGEFIKEGDLPK